MSELRAGLEFAFLLHAYPVLSTLPRGDGHPVIVLPGLAADDISTRPLRAFLRERGYAAHALKLGRNDGLKPGIEEAQLARLREIRGRYGRKVSLVGWSLGGVYARQLAKMEPDRVRTVITLGSPFGGQPTATNAWRIYEIVSGKRAADSDATFGGALSDPPPVPSTAIYSRTDGICAYQICMEQPSAKTENIEVQGSHCGLGHNPSVVYAVADRLAQPEDQWRPFHRSGWRSLVYADPNR
jgi:pimeloyl-ACP methyl ester carboxylesterase